MDDKSTPGERSRKGCKRLWFLCWDDSGNRFPPIRIFFLLGSFLFYCADVVLDMWVAGEHYIAARDGTDPFAQYYFQATLFFIAFPLVMVNFLSWALYTWGWAMHRFGRVKKYCEDRSGDLVYYEPGLDGEYRRGQNTCVRTNKQLIFWPQKRNAEVIPKRQSGRPNNNGAQALPVSELSQVPSFSQAAEDTDVKGSSAAGTSTRSSGGAETLELELLSGTESEIERVGSTTPIIADKDEVDGDLNQGSDDTDGLEFYPLDIIETWEWVYISIIHLFMLGYLFRVIRLLHKNARKDDPYPFDRYRDISFLRLMEAFLEAAPQSVLQLYIVIIRLEPRLIYRIITPISIVSSVISLALAVGDYISAEKDIYYYDPPPTTRCADKPNQHHFKRLSWTGYFIIILWHLFMITSRLISLALFATVYGRYLFLVLGIHYAMMVYFAYKQHAHVFTTNNSDYFDPRHHLCTNCGIEFIIAAFSTFFHFKIKDGSAIETIVPFYSILFIENTLCITLWYVGRDTSIDIWYEETAMVVVFLTFLIGLGLLILYYWHFQPQHQPAPGVVPCPGIHHPTTMTASLSRRYRRSKLKKREGNLFSYCSY